MTDLVPDVKPIRRPRGRPKKHPNRLAQKPPASKVEPMLLSLRDACAALGLSKSTLYALLGEGRLKCLRIGRRTLFRRDDLTAFIEAAARSDCT